MFTNDENFRKNENRYFAYLKIVTNSSIFFYFLSIFLIYQEISQVNSTLWSPYLFYNKAPINCGRRVIFFSKSYCSLFLFKNLLVSYAQSMALYHHWSIHAFFCYSFCLFVLLYLFKFIFVLFYCILSEFSQTYPSAYPQKATILMCLCLVGVGLADIII